MTRLLHVAGLATTLISHSPAAADTRHTCGAGVVRAVQRVSETTIRETAASGPEATGGPVVVDHGAERHERRVLVTVQLGHPDGTDYRAPLAAVSATCLAPKRDTCNLVP
jgi:hypothetical protein